MYTCICMCVCLFCACSWFSKEQYFDPGGFFILTVFSGPIVINCFIIVVGGEWEWFQGILVQIGHAYCVGGEGVGHGWRVGVVSRNSIHCGGLLYCKSS